MFSFLQNSDADAGAGSLPLARSGLIIARARSPLPMAQVGSWEVSRFGGEE